MAVRFCKVVLYAANSGVFAPIVGAYREKLTGWLIR